MSLMPVPPLPAPDVIPLTPRPDPDRVAALASAITASGRDWRYCLLQPDASGYWRAAAELLRNAP